MYCAHNLAQHQETFGVFPGENELHLEVLLRALRGLGCEDGRLVADSKFRVKRLGFRIEDFGFGGQGLNSGFRV